jgi:hypothetical protein
MTNVQLAKDLIKEFTSGSTCKYSKKKLGEILHKRYPFSFKNAEAGRDAIRLVTGARGHLLRKKVKTRIEWSGFELPEQEKNDYSKYEIFEKRIGILSDIHFPYADLKALNAAVKYLIDWKPSCIVLNGDILDAYQASDFQRDPRQRGLKYEIDVTRDFLSQLRKLFPKTRIIYKVGNHEERYERAILQRLPEFLDLEWTKLRSCFRIK